MAFSTDDFSKVWASTSPLTPYEFSESNYKEGWNFIGGTPPSRQMWDSIQKSNDEKLKYLFDNCLPLTGGTITGNLAVSGILSAGVGLPPVGSVTAFAGSTTPTGWLLCDGSAVSRTDYADLYAVIGDTYGDGDGSTTFNVPDLVDKFIEGSATSGTVKSAGLPNITGDLGFSVGDMAITGAFGFNTDKQCPVVYGNNGDYNPNIDASRCSSIYGNSSTVQPPALTMRYIIKY